MVVSIRREKIRGKFFITARDKGKIIDKRRWSKEFTINKAKRIFKQNNTFEEGVSVRKLSSRPEFREFTDRRKSPSIQKKVPFRVVVTGKLKDGTIIAASSMSEHWDSFEEAKAEADKSFLELLSAEISNVYDADEGMKQMNKVVSMRSEVITVR